MCVCVCVWAWWTLDDTCVLEITKHLGAQWMCSVRWSTVVISLSWPHEAVAFWSTLTHFLKTYFDLAHCIFYLESYAIKVFFQVKFSFHNCLLKTWMCLKHWLLRNGSNIGIILIYWRRILILRGFINLNLQNNNKIIRRR